MKEHSINPSEEILDINEFFLSNDKRLQTSKVIGVGMFFDIVDGNPQMACGTCLCRSDEEFEKLTSIIGVALKDNPHLAELFSVALGKAYAFQALSEYNKGGITWSMVDLDEEEDEEEDEE